MGKRKNKGYQKDHNRRYGYMNSWAAGTNKSLEEYIADSNKQFDARVETAKKEYAKISKWTTLSGEELYKACRDALMWEVKFDRECNLIPLEKALEMIENSRRRCVDSCKYSKWNGYQRRIINKDNQKFCYNSSGGGSGQRIRVPSLKRSDATWRRFYELFPELKGQKTYMGIKLKKV